MEKYFYDIISIPELAVHYDYSFRKYKNQNNPKLSHNRKLCYFFPKKQTTPPKLLQLPDFLEVWIFCPSQY